MKKLFFLIFLLSASAVYILSADEQNSISVSGGIFPTTMGTVGEHLFLEWKITPNFFLTATENHDKTIKSDFLFQYSGTDISGLIDKEVTSLSGGPGARLGYGIARFSVTGTYFYSNIDTYKTGRKIVKDKNYIDDTAGFIDFNISEYLHGAKIGGGLDFDLKSILFKLSGSYTPFCLGERDSTFLETFGEFTPNGTHQYNWRKNTTSLQTNGTGFELGAQIGLRFVGIMLLHLSGNLDTLTQTGDINLTNTMLNLFSNDGDVTEINYSNEAKGSAFIDNAEITIGTSAELLFLNDFNFISVSPVLGVSYVKNIRTENFDYDNGYKEKWKDNYDYIRFIIIMEI